MRLLHCALQLGLLSAAFPSAYADSAWGFSDATVSVQTKGAGVGAGFQEKISEDKPLSKPVSLGGSDTLKITLTAQEGRSAKRPHQAFLLLKDPATGLDISYPFSVKDNGKSKLELTQKDLPTQFLAASELVDARFVIGSFGSSKAYDRAVFKLSIDRDPDEPLPSPEVVRYGKLPEIHHIFKPAPKIPPVIVSVIFAAMVIAAFPILAGVWLYLGANVNHLPTAMKSAPIPHILFVGSIVGLEGIFFLYYTSWNLFRTLPVALAVGAVTFISGSRALGEVQGRRLAGLR